MFEKDSPVYRAKFGARRFEVDPRRQPAEEVGHAMDAPIDHRRGQMVRARHDVGDDFGFGRIRDRRLEHADDGRRAVAELDCPADDAKGRSRASVFQ